jgi:hypothetical protein
MCGAQEKCKEDEAGDDNFNANFPPPFVTCSPEETSALLEESGQDSFLGYLG